MSSKKNKKENTVLILNKYGKSTTRLLTENK